MASNRARGEELKEESNAEPDEERKERQAKRKAIRSVLVVFLVVYVLVWVAVGPQNPVLAFYGSLFLLAPLVFVIMSIRGGTVTEGYVPKGKKCPRCGRWNGHKRVACVICGTPLD